jgi:hypothetical protein
LIESMIEIVAGCAFFHNPRAFTTMNHEHALAHRTTKVAKFFVRKLFHVSYVVMNHEHTLAHRTPNTQRITKL